MSGHAVPMPVDASGPSNLAPAAMEVEDVQCSWCGGTRVRRLRRHSFDRLRTLITGRYPFRCSYCHTKFYSAIPRRISK